ncbi:MAG: hypothetical protein WCD53_22640 [Microcoleus sp.]
MGNGELGIGNWEFSLFLTLPLFHSPTLPLFPTLSFCLYPERYLEKLK